MTIEETVEMLRSWIGRFGISDIRHDGKRVITVYHSEQISVGTKLAFVQQTASFVVTWVEDPDYAMFI